MDEQLNTRLKIIEDKLDENQKVLVKLRNAQRTANYIKIVYWGFIILAGLGAFYFIKPVLGQLGEAYGITSNNSDSQSSSFSTSALLEQLKEFKANNQTN